MIVVADTSVLVNLCKVERVHLLRQLFTKVAIPLEVEEEFRRLSEFERFKGLSLPDWIDVSSAGSQKVLPGVEELDAGERAALLLAIEIRANLILIDERKGFRAAVKLGLKPLGIIGVLLQAKRVGAIASVGNVLSDLRSRAGFWISEELHSQVLEISGEA